MAITFEQRKDINKIFIAVLLVLLLLAGIGFFVWKIYWRASQDIPEVTPTQVRVDYRVLNDERIVSMELFPSIPAAEENNIGKKNPFAENEAVEAVEANEQNDESGTNDNKLENDGNDGKSENSESRIE